MPLPAFSEIAGAPEFAALSPEDQDTVSNRYWDSVEAENPAAKDYVTAQRERSSSLLQTRRDIADAAPVPRRFLEHQAERVATGLAVDENIARGTIAPEEGKAFLEQRGSELADQDAKMKETGGLFDPANEETTRPAFEALSGYAKLGGVFGSAPFNARAADLLPGNDLVKSSHEAYRKLRDETATKYHLSTEELDDVVKHQLDLQTEPVSRDAFGTTYVKNEVLAQGPQATEAAIQASGLPGSVKEKLVKDLPERLEKFKADVVEKTFSNHPELAQSLGIDRQVADPTQTETRGNLPAGNRYQTTDEQFALISDELNKHAASQAAGGAKAGLMGTLENIIPGKAGEDAADSRKRTESINQLSNEINQSKVKLFGSDAAVYGQGAYSVLESAVVGAATGGLAEPIEAAKIAKMGVWGQRLAKGLNSVSKVSGIAGLSATKQGVQTYEQAIAAGKTPEEAGKLALVSAGIEFGLTAAFSAGGHGGLEDVATAGFHEATKKGAKEFFKGLGKGVLDEEAEELSIAAFDTALVQSKINPEMTVADFKQQMFDTAAVTFFASAGAHGIHAGIEKLQSEPTHEQSTDELRVAADLALAEASKSGAADPLAAGTAAPEPAAALRAVDTPADGAPVPVAGEGDIGVRDGGEGTPTSLTDETKPQNKTEADSPDAKAPGEQIRQPDSGPRSPRSDEIRGEKMESQTNPTGEINLLQSDSESAARISLETTTPQSNEQNEGQKGQGRQEVLTPEDAVSSADGIPETSTIPAQPEVTEPETPKAGKSAETKETGTAPATDEKTPAVEKTEKAKPETPQERETTGIKNAITEQKRKEGGLPVRQKTETRGAEVSQAEAARRIEKAKEEGRNEGKSVVEKFVENPDQAPTDVENDILVHETGVREKALDVARKNLEKASDEDRVARLRDLEGAESDISEIYKVRDDTTSGAAGRALQSRKNLFHDDFSVARLTAQAQRDNGNKPLTDTQRKRISATAEKLAENAAAQAANADKAAQAQAQTTFKEQARRFKKEAKSAMAQGEKPQSFLERQAAAAKERILARKREGRQQLNLDPTDLVDHAIVGVSYIANGIKTIADFTSKLVKDFGEYVREHAPAIFQKSQELASVARQKPSKVKTRNEILSALKPGDPVNGKVIYDIARAHINAGLDGFENVMNAVLGDLKSSHPDLTLRQVHDAYSGYGKVKFPSKDEVKVKLRDFKNLARLTSQLEDVRNKIAPLKTGPQRDALSDRARRLQKTIKEEQRRLGVKPPSSKAALRSGLEATKTRLQNTFNDFDNAIKTGVPIDTTRTPQELDQEAKGLKQKVEDIRKDYNELFKNKEISDKQRAQAAEKLLDRSITFEEDLLARGLVSKPANAKETSAWSQGIADRQARLKELRDARTTLRKARLPGADHEHAARQRAEKALEAGLKRDQEILATGNSNKEGPAPAPLTPTERMKSLLQERAAVKDVVDEIRKNAPRTHSQEEGLLKRLDRQLAELDRRIQTGDVTPAAKTTPKSPSSAAEAKRKAEIKQKQETLAALKKAARPKLTKEEARLKRDKAATQKRIDNYAERIKTGNYAQEVKSPPVSDAELRRLKYQEEKIKADYQEAHAAENLRKASLGKKFIHYTSSVLAARNLVKLGFDIGAFTRQGSAFIARSLFHPKQFAAAVKNAVKAGFSQQQEHAVYEAVKNRPNAAWDKTAGLHFVSPFEQERLKHHEDIPTTDLLAKLPWYSVVGPLARSGERFQRAYTNTIRSVWFDSLAKGIGGLTNSEAKDLGRFVMVATGRGTVKGLEPAIPVANKIFLATRFYISQVQHLTASPVWQAGGSARTKKRIAAEYGRLIVSRALFYAVASALYRGKEDEENGVVFDPRSSDFMKFKVKGTRIDPMGGMAQFVTVLSRIITKTKVNEKGQVVSLGEGAKFRQDITEEALRFLGTKRNLNLAFLWDTWKGEYYGGKKRSLPTMAEEFIAPLIIRDTIEIFQKHGPVEGALIFAAMISGSGVNTRTSEFQRTPKGETLGPKVPVPPKPKSPPVLKNPPVRR